MLTPSQTERAVRASIRAQSWSTAIGCHLALLGLLLLVVPGHVGMGREGWILTGGALLTAGVLNVAVALLASRRYVRRLSDLHGDASTQPHS